MSEVVGLVLSWINPLSLLNKTRIYFRTRKFKHIFGQDACKFFHVIYNVYENPILGTIFPKPKPKVQRRRKSGGGTTLTTVHSIATTRSISHLVYGFTRVVEIAPKVVSDVEYDDKMDLSFVSIGGNTNFKTVDLLEDRANMFLDFEILNLREAFIISKTSGREILKAGSEHGFDHGFIIKIHPNNNKDRTWICCAGFAEWATSGAAWYLAHKWKEIYKWAKRSEFALIIKTKKGSDESTSVLHKFLNLSDMKS